jgi:hypothetical protein
MVTQTVPQDVSRHPSKSNGIWHKNARNLGRQFDRKYDRHEPLGAVNLIGPGGL